MKKNTKRFLLLSLLVVFGLAMTACGTEGPAGPAGPAGPEGPAGPAGEAGMAADDTACSDCHNDAPMLSGVAHQWEEALHATGHAAGYAGARAGCSACHSSAGFSAMIDAGSNPGEFEYADAHPVGPDCRACHQIHETYTGADWALETSDDVVLYAFEDVTYEGGAGNLCATCHQPRRQFEAVDGIVNISSTHWGPHHGPQSAMLLGVGGAGDVEGSASLHYQLPEDGCVSCHMGENADHTFEPNMASCETCHVDAESFDINGKQTEIETLAVELYDLLVANGLWDAEKDVNIVGEFPEDQASAVWNYIFIVKEDKSMGAHNADYTEALLNASIAVFAP
ncbi:MAG: hypothetical protein ABFS17_03130 [Chloroflexota bacterium]